MAEISEGWDGTVNEATMARILAAAAPPRIDSGFTIEAVAGQRRVILAAGESHHGFIRYVKDDASVIDLPTPAAGRWYLIAQRRDWATNTVQTVILDGPETVVGSAYPVPNAYPSDLEDTPGVVADFPLYWVWARASDTQIRIRKAQSIIDPATEWAFKSGPTSAPGAPGGSYANIWNKGRDSGGTLNATSEPLGIIIGTDGIYEAVAKHRTNGTNSGAAYIGLAINGSRTALENRTEGAWFHDHASVNYTSSESRYFGPLSAGELLTAGPNTGAANFMYFGTQGLYGGIFLRRIS